MIQNLPHREEAFAISWMRIFACLSPGQSGCGKTNTVMHILRKPLVYYDKIHFFTPNQHQDKIVDLQKVMKPISKKVGYEVLELAFPR